MFRRLPLVLIVTGALAAEAQLATPEAAPPHSFTVTFWNIQWFPGRRPNATHGEEQRQVAEVHREIGHFPSDVIAMEEVRDWNAAAVAVEPLHGFHVDVCSTFPPREGQTDTQQVAITSRLWPISAWSELWKPGAAITPPRGFVFAACERPSRNQRHAEVAVTGGRCSVIASSRRRQSVALHQSRNFPGFRIPFGSRARLIV